jgi:glutamate/tyrosine decarboxylase-like PLP-dependent enzyme
LDRYSRQIEQNVEQARYLGRLVEENPQLELLAPITLNIVCFRYTVPGMDDSTLNELNQELLLRLSESGEFAPSSTQLDGKYAIRAAITNHRSRREDFDRLVEKVVELGTILEGEMQVGGQKVGA